MECLIWSGSQLINWPVTDLSTALVVRNWIELFQDLTKQFHCRSPPSGHDKIHFLEFTKLGSICNRICWTEVFGWGEVYSTFNIVKRKIQVYIQLGNIRNICWRSCNLSDQLKLIFQRRQQEWLKLPLLKVCRSFLFHKPQPFLWNLVFSVYLA